MLMTKGKKILTNWLTYIAAATDTANSDKHTEKTAYNFTDTEMYHRYR